MWVWRNLAPNFADSSVHVIDMFANAFIIIFAGPKPIVYFDGSFYNGKDCDLREFLKR